MISMISTLIFASLAQAQSQPANSAVDSRVADLLERSVEIRSIDAMADDDDFADLMPLKELIGDARLVVLGEQSHGDGAVFYAKARLVKFLHQHMGFDVLTWESGMFDCRETDRALKDPAVPMEEVAKFGIFAIWTHSAQVTPTLDYVRWTHTTSRPLETAGFDHQFSTGGESRWPAAIIACFDKADPSLLPAELRASLEAGLKPMLEKDAAKIDALIELWQRIPALMDRRRSVLELANGTEEFAFLRRTADDALVSLRSIKEFLARQGEPKATLNNTRDERMAANLIWQVEDKYKGRKVIAWMATFHAAHEIQEIHFPMRAGLYDGVVNCGTVAHNELGDGMYTIGFTAAEGQAGNVWGKTVHTLAPPSPDSFEHLCAQTGKPFLFTDFKSLPADHWLRQPMVSRPLGYGEMTAEWPRQMDAMFYIRRMFPSTKEPMLPVDARIHADQ